MIRKEEWEGYNIRHKGDSISYPIHEVPTVTTQTDRQTDRRQTEDRQTDKQNGSIHSIHSLIILLPMDRSINQSINK